MYDKLRILFSLMSERKANIVREEVIYRTITDFGILPVIAIKLRHTVGIRAIGQLPMVATIANTLSKESNVSRRYQLKVTRSRDHRVLLDTVIRKMSDTITK